MKQLLTNPVTQQHIDRFIATPSHAVMLISPQGSGKASLAGYIAEQILNLTSGQFSEYPYGHVIKPVDTKAIGIESVRELEHLLSLKVPNSDALNRIIIIEDAHKLTIEAQNALLKTLEEPPHGTMLILTVGHKRALLPTIVSRCQTIVIKPPEQQTVIEFFTQQGIADTQVKQAFTISGGLIGLMSALLTDSEHPLLAATVIARQLLGQGMYDRLLAVERISKQRQEAVEVLFILQQMAHISLQSATGQAGDKWQRILEASYNTTEQLNNSAQPKLALTNLMLTI